MSRSVGDELPAALLERLNGERLEEQIGFTVLLLTMDGDGWPRTAMLSAGEVVAAEAQQVRLALWPDSASTANLARGGRCVLAMVHAGSGWYVRCSARRGADLRLGDGKLLAFFELDVADVLEDLVAYARLVDGVRFELPEPEPVLRAWRETINALRLKGSRTNARE